MEHSQHRVVKYTLFDDRHPSLRPTLNGTEVKDKFPAPPVQQRKQSSHGLLPTSQPSTKRRSHPPKKSQSLPGGPPLIPSRIGWEGNQAFAGRSPNSRLFQPACRAGGCKSAAAVRGELRKLSCLQLIGAPKWARWGASHTPSYSISARNVVAVTM